MNCYNAARAAGYSETTAHSRTKDLNKAIKIADVLERQGLTDVILVKKLTELLEASDFVFKKDVNGKSEIIGDVKLYSPAWSARVKALELALKLKDLLKDKTEHTEKKELTVINIHRADGTIEREDGTGLKANTITRRISI